MPIIFWDKLCKENDLKYLLISGELTNEAIDVHNKISDEIINEFGISDKFKRILSLKLQIEMLWSDILFKGERYKELQVNIKEAELEKIEKQNSEVSQSIYKSFFIIEKSLGFKLNYDKITIREYYTYMNGIEEQNKLMKQ